MITIGKLYTEQINGKVRLIAETDIDGNKNDIWFEVEQKYAPYLCHERSDAYVIGMLNYAMRNGHDITCLTPMSEDLYFQITTYLIESLSKNCKALHKTVLITDIDSSELPSAQAIGTGISCGIDSLHALSQQTNTRLKKHNITHLVFNNVGSHGVGERAAILYNGRKSHVERFAKEYGYEFVATNSNFMEIIPQSHYQTDLYTSTFAIYALQKLYSSYFYASARVLWNFSLKDTNTMSASQYALLFIYACTTKSVTIYNEGSTMSRLEKTRQVVEYAPSYKYLNVCTDQVTNCGRCEKCARTLLALDALGKLELYADVFDINYYKKNRQKYYALMMEKHFSKSPKYFEVYHLLKGKVSLKAKLIGAVGALYPYASARLPEWLKPPLKKIYRFIVGSHSRPTK